MNQPRLFDDRVTLNKYEGYRSQFDEESSADKTSGTYAEMVEEVEKVSEMLIHTQTKLHKSQDELKSYGDKTHMLESTLRQRDKDLRDLRDQNDVLVRESQNLREENKKLSEESTDREVGPVRPELERRQRKAIEFLKKDLDSAREKYTKAQDEIMSQKLATRRLERSIQDSKDNDNKAKLSSQALITCTNQLKEAKGENASLLEELADLQGELQRTKRCSEEKESLLRNDIESKVKEKIKHEVREAVTKQVTEKVTRDVTSQMKSEREKELETLREQFKRIFKENSVLKSQIEAAEKKALKATKLEEKVQEQRDELSKSQVLLDSAKRERETSLSAMESEFRLKLHSIKEESAQEKWAHAAEIRKQMSIEREREVEDFTSRIEALSKQTDRLLQRAEKEKESYGIHMKKKAAEEKQHEIRSLMDKLAERTKDSEELLQNAKHDKEAYADQIRQEVEEEKRREIIKFTYRIEVLTGEKEALQKRVDKFEEELNWTYQQNETNVDQLKQSHSGQKALEDENFKLKRKNQNLTTLVDRYKKDSEESSKELKNSKKLFREAIMKSEEQSIKLKAKLKKYEPLIEQSRESYSETVQAMEEMEQTKDSLLGQIRGYELENSRLKQENEKLRKSQPSQTSSEDTLNKAALQVETENAYLRERIRSLESLQDRIKQISQASENQRKLGETTIQDDSSNLEESLVALETENTQLKVSMRDLGSIVEQYKDDLEHTRSSSRHEIEILREKLQDSNHLLDQYRSHRVETARELERSKQFAEDARTVASEDDTVQLNMEIQTIERMLDMFKTGDGQTPPDNAHQSFDLHRTLVQSEQEIDRLKEEIGNLTSMLDQGKVGHHLSEEDSSLDGSPDFVDAISKLKSTHEQTRDELTQANNEKILLAEKIEDLNDLLERYRSELSQTSDELEQTRQTLAVEGETSNKLSHRVQSLNLLLDTTEQNHANNSKELAKYNQRVTEAEQTSRKEIERLNAEIESLRVQLSKSKNEAAQVMQEGESEREELEENLKTSEQEIILWKEKLEEVEEELEHHATEHTKLTKELQHSKRLFKETLVKSEDEIFELKQRIEILTKGQSELVEMSRELQLARKRLAASEARAAEQIRETEDALKDARCENDKLSQQLEEAAAQHRLTMQSDEEEKFSLSKAVDDLNTALEASREDYSNISDVLHHSERLFKEALAAWKQETEELMEEMALLRRGTPNVPRSRGFIEPSVGSEANAERSSAEQDYRLALQQEFEALFDRGSSQRDLPKGRGRDSGATSEGNISFEVALMPTTTSPFDDSDNDSQSSSSELLTRLDDLFRDKKKRVTWKESEFDVKAFVNGMSLGGTKASPGELRSALRGERSVALPKFLEQKDTMSALDAPEERREFVNTFSVDSSQREMLANFEQAIRNDRKDSAVSSLEDSLSNNMEKTVTSESSSLSATLDRARWLKPAQTAATGSDFGALHENTPAMPEDSRSIDDTRELENTEEDRDGLGPLDVPEDNQRQPGRARALENNSPIRHVDTEDQTFEDATIDSEIQNSCGASTAPTSVQSEEGKAKLTHAKIPMEYDDDSTLGWNLQNSDESESSRGRSQKGDESSPEEEPNQEESITGNQKLVSESDKRNAEPSISRNESGTSEESEMGDDDRDGRDDLESPARSTPVKLESEAHPSSLPSSFSYSSTDSTSDASQKKTSDNAKGQSHVGKSPTAKHAAPPRGATKSKTKSVFQRAMEKASRRNWSKQAMTQYVSKQASRRKERSEKQERLERPSISSVMTDEQPFDEGPEATGMGTPTEMCLSACTEDAQIALAESNE